MASETYDMLCAVGRELNAMPNNEVTYKELLNRLNAKESQLPQPNAKGV